MSDDIVRSSIHRFDNVDAIPSDIARRVGPAGAAHGGPVGDAARRLMMHMTAILTPADIGGYVAYNPETGTASQGATFEEAIANLREAVELYLQEFPMKLGGAAIVTHFDVPVHA